ncbi:Yos1-like protein [Pisolithus albus]|nr:Yos1-like protein [Pisolithus albus]
MLTIGTIIYVALLLINAMAVLSEERFLARIGWSSVQPHSTNVGYQHSFDQNGYGYGQQDVGVKVRIINLISAVRTLMRSKRACVQVPLIGLNLVVIVYELVLGG